MVCLCPVDCGVLEGQGQGLACVQRGAQTAPSPEQGSRMADLILEPLQHGEASVFPLSTPQFLKLLYKRPFSPLLEKRKICALQDETTFRELTPGFLLLQAACQKPGAAREEPENLSAAPGPIPAVPLHPSPGRRGSGWCLLAQALGAFPPRLSGCSSSRHFTCPDFRGAGRFTGELGLHSTLPL